MTVMTGHRKDGADYQILTNPAGGTPSPFIAVYEKPTPDGGVEIEVKGCQTLPEAKHWIVRR